MMKVLSVAEKNDAAKRIAALLSRATAVTKPTRSKYNKLYEFQQQFQGQACEVVMTSVSGHLLQFDFTDAYRKWYSCDPVELFDAPVVKTCPQNYADIKRTLEGLAPYAHVLVIWTDCDREGENIGFEIIDTCKGINPRLRVFRAKFSEITPTAITRAWNNLTQPDKRLSDAVNVRSELDLRIGAAFTRFQTLRLCRRFPQVLNERLISYGSCQFPTLGFVVERYKSIQEFVPEDFWKIEVSHKKEESSVDFNWARVRLFNKLAVQILYEKCLDNPLARVVKVQSKPKSKWRPVALDTVEFEKLSSRKLRINAKEAMKIAEKLYTQGIISYPRTETNIFPQGLDLKPLIEQQQESRAWGGFATRLAQSGQINPRNGKNTDQAHPPIHPTRFDASLQGNEAKVYELIVRHFLACCSKDAKGLETTVEIEIAEEKFVGHGLHILERNYLEVYPYDKWSDKELPNFNEGETFRPTRIEMVESETSPPNLLTEADLIALMEKHGIGTDATHAEHIETIKSRMYVGVQPDGKFVPGQLGMGLVEGYDAMGFEMSKPRLRSQLEEDLKGISEGRKDAAIVLREQVQKYKQVFIAAQDQVNRLDAAVAKFLNQDVNNGGGAGGPPPRFPPGGGSSARGGSRRPPPDDDDDDGGGHGGGAPSWGGALSSRPFASTSTGNVMGGSRGARVGWSSSSSSVPNGGNSSNEIVCHCGQVPDTRIVSKNNENKGRQFKSCSACNFFAWCDEGRVGVQPGGSGSTGRSAGYSSVVRYDSAVEESHFETVPGIPVCKCSIPAVSLTVKKEGDNKGRLFFGCSKGLSASDKCDFFQWDDEGIGRSAPTTGGRSRGGGGSGNFSEPFSSRGARSKRARGGRGASAAAGGPRRARKCGLCGEEGHTRRNCPVSDELAHTYDDGE